MSGYMDFTAAELADLLGAIGRLPHMTGPLSMLDEATLAYGWRYDTIGPAQKAFADARHAHMRSYRTETGNYSGEAWDRAVAAAHALADALRPLGDFKFARCQGRREWGACNTALLDDGTCPYAERHLVTAAEGGPS